MRAKEIKLEDIKSAYFIGIGGIGMSAIARFLNVRGVEVSGYDKTSTALTKTLESEGMQIHYSEDLSALPKQIDLVVYTPAIPDAHIELKYLKQSSIPVLKRAEVLGLLSRSMSCIGIAGTHGKTTTSTLLTYLLKEAGVDVSAFLGGISRDFGSNYVAGKSNWLVVEADEFDRSFLRLNPQIGSIISADADHLDIYGTEKEILDGGFRAYAQQVKDRVFVNAAYADLFPSIANKVIYGINTGDWYATNIEIRSGHFYFDLIGPEVHWKGLQSPLPGRHNIENAVLALAICCGFELAENQLRSALKSFKGIARRFDRIIQRADCVFIDDYAHHPTELKAAISAVRELNPGKKLTGIFQPHLFSRTQDFAEGFGQALAALDELYLLEIYPAREEPIEGIDAAFLLDKVPLEHKQVISKEALLEKIKSKRPDVLITLGAGDIDRLVEPIKHILENQD